MGLQVGNVSVPAKNCGHVSDSVNSCFLIGLPDSLRIFYPLFSLLVTTCLTAVFDGLQQVFLLVCVFINCCSLPAVKFLSQF